MVMWLVGLGIAFILIAAISISWTYYRGAPWAPTPMSLVHQMLQMAEVGLQDVVYDLGCGDGRMIVTAARRYGARAVGIEIDPLRYLWCQLLITVLGLRSRVRVVYGDFFKQEFRDADVVTCYLLRDTNKQLEEKLKRELKPGTRVISNYFIFPGLQLVQEDKEAKLYLYQIKAST